ncbi:GGDEF domain-containing protein [Thermanaerothrix daxensis]|uniref:GGDEF domain-containing protein n=1 Tax=Thermanaerothrix daxensis TaxID=869279 RepID=UPI0006C903E2|nr:GGDEF domain-containing protein [Thermanaerothrix daxensis]
MTDRPSSEIPAPAETPFEITRRWERRRRYFYLFASLAGIPSILAVWLQHHTDNPFIAITYPVLILAGLAWSAALLWPRIPLAWIERTVLLTISLLFLSKLVYLLFFTPNLASVWAEVEAVFWVFAFIFVIGYIALPRHLALGLSVFHLVVTSVLGLWRFWDGPSLLGVEFLRLEVRIAGLSFLLFVLARTKDEFSRTLLAANQMHQMAHTDSLTQLPNRRGLNRLLEEHLARRKPFTVILVDIDHFKLINDTFGHESGDVILRQVGECLQRQIRAGDVIGRWGGEEFLILAAEQEAQSALQLAQRLRETVEGFDFNQGIPVTASFGVTLSREQDTPDSLIKRADLALYRAKHNGRNRVEWEAP